MFLMTLALGVSMAIGPEAAPPPPQAKLGIVITEPGVVSYGDIGVSVDPVVGGSRSHGYVEYRVTVVNRGAQRAHSVRLTIPDYSRGIQEVSRTMAVAASSSVIVSVFVPVMPIYGGGLGVTIDGERQDTVVPILYVSAGENRPCVLFSQSAQKKGTFANTVTTPPTPAPFSSFPAGAPLTAWSTSWLGYSTFDGIVVTEDDMRGMPADVSAALQGYVDCGGTLLILGNWKIPESWGLRQKERVSIPTYCAGFGEYLVTDQYPSQFSSTDLKYLQDVLNESKSPYQDSRTLDAGQANSIFPVVDKLNVPVRGLFLLMLLFVIVIGPLNLFVLSRKKKKIWLLWTVPAISLITCVAVSGYTLFSEGWSSKSRTAALTVLDETSHHATTIGWSAFYCPLTPGDGLHYGYETELTAEIGAFYSYGGGQGGTNRTMDWTEDQHLEGWITARVPAHFKVRKSELRRERMTLSMGQDGSLAIVNGLGADVSELWLANWDGKVYRANNILAGAYGILIPQPNIRAVGVAGGLRTAFSVSEWFDFSLWTRTPLTFLVPGSYIAVLKSSPFVEQGLRDAGSRKSEAVVYGLMKKD